MNRRFSFAFAAFCAVGLSFAASAETWTWTGKGTWRYKDSAKDWQDGANWEDSKGVAGTQYPDNTYRPGNGDILILNGAGYSHVFGPSSGAYGGVVYTNSFGGSYGSYVPIQDGGFVRYATSGAKVENQSYQCNGTFEFYVASPLYVVSHFNNGTGTIRKTGAGELRLTVGTVSYRTTCIEIEEGTLGVNLADALTSLSTSLVFDGDDVTLDLKDKPQTMTAALVETPGISGHRITSSGNVCLTLNGAKQVDMTFSGKVTGKASICWYPSEAKTLTFAGGENDTTGTLIVSNGVIEVAAGTTFANAKFDVEGGQLKFDSKVVLASGCVTVNDTVVEDGFYTGSGPLGQQVDWLSGDQLVVIGVGGESGETVEATWNGTGDMSTVANWQDATDLPPLGKGSVKMLVAGGTSATVDRDYWIRGIEIDSGVSTFGFDGDSLLWLGSLGLKTLGKTGVTLTAPMGVTCSQLWNLTSGGTLHVKAPLVEVSPGAVLSITNGAVKFYGGIHDVAIASNDAFSFQDSTETVFRKDVRRCQTASSDVSCGNVATTRIVYGGGLYVTVPASDCRMCGSGTTVFTNGILNVDNNKRVNFSSGEYHFYSPNNSFNNGQRGYIHGNAVLYFHVTNAFTSTQANLAGYHGDGGVIDLCGCDQTIGSIQCGRGLTRPAGKTGWKWGLYPGTIRSEKPAILHITVGGYSINPSSSSSPTTTNCAYFVGQAGISYEGGSTGHWLNQTCSSTGTVQTTKGNLYFSKRVVDADGCDLGEGSWPNAAKAIAKGSGTLVFEHSKAIGKKTDVIIEGNGKVQLDAGVNQRCANLYFGDEKQELGTWGSLESAATHKDARFTGTGILTVRGQTPGIVLIFR